MDSVFVFGLFADSPGKTTFSIGLLHEMREWGISVAPLKGRASHSFWHHYNAFERCLGEGRLYSRDVVKLRDAADCDEVFEVLNPIDALVSPLDPKLYLEEGRMRNLYLDRGNLFNNFVLERYTHVKGGEVVNRFLVRRDSRQLIDEGIIDTVLEGADEVIEVDSLSEWSEVYNRSSAVSIVNCVSYLGNMYDFLVAESFTDIIYPAPDYEHVAVIGVAPGSAVHYDPVRLKRAVELQSGGGQARAMDVVHFLEPEKVHELPALNDEERMNPTKVAQAYSEAIEWVLNKL
ncbi:hypothetical protein GF326_02515 [Candidatus Bathyarchaeota archaeon]|nr:hypothetical protein [Candidatus Bathyarchaeota archaeon]